VTAAPPVRPAMTSAELLLAWDRKRTAQRKLGLSMSAVGGCRRRAGYLLAETPPVNPSGSVQSAMGSAAHDKIAEAARDLFPADLVEQPVEFAGIPGTLDRYDAELHELIDTKTTSSRWLDHVKLHGIDQSWRWQTAGYAAALIAQGLPVRSIRLDVIARDTGEEWTTRRPFDSLEVEHALVWVAEVEATPLEALPRDYAPDSAFCRGCPFLQTCWEGGIPDRDPRTVLYLEDPDAAAWARKLWDARQAKMEAAAAETEAKAALDAIRGPDRQPVAIDGYDKALRWREQTTWRIDTKAVEADYQATGAKVPRKPATSVVLEFVPLDQETP
jgi:hypothetical protein